MYTSQAKPGWHEIDGRRVYTDSLMEAAVIRRLVKNGFSGKWRRPVGVGYGKANYTPDLELSINWNGQNRRAIIEIKAINASQFKIDARDRAVAALHYYGRDVLLLLYVEKTKRWYSIDPVTKHTIACPAPTPSELSIQTYPAAIRGIRTTNFYGRSYKSDSKAYIATKTADGLEFIVRLFFRSSKVSRNKRTK